MSLNFRHSLGQMQEFKSPASRLVRLFKKGRDNWREKALERKQEIRGLEIKIRDLSESRENWKKRAVFSRATNKTAKSRRKYSRKKEEIRNEKTNLEVDAESEELNAQGHHYSIKTIQKSLDLMINCGISFRGIEKVFDLFRDLDSQKTPSFSSIRKWLGRIGIYELTREKERRDDWIFIVDFTLELGKQKALVILGIPQDNFVEIVANNKKGLSHEDVEVLAIEIMNSTRGELIEKALDRVSEKVGTPIQIVADNSSDLARGIKLYSQKHPSLIYTHDVTHGMALLLKYQLDSDDRYQSFIQKCTVCRQRLQQTELYFLAPPAQRSQCRYFNIERLTDWGINLLNSSTETLIKLLPNVDYSIILPKIKDKLGWLADFQSDRQALESDGFTNAKR